MTYSILKFVHILGAILIGAGLIGVWISDMRSRQLREIEPFSEAIRNIAVFLRWGCRAGRNFAPGFRNMVDNRIFWRMGLHQHTMARWNGGVISIRVCRGEYCDTNLLHAITPFNKSISW